MYFAYWFFFIIFLFNLLTNCVYAEEDYGGAKFICEYAKALYKQGQIEEAKHEFNKVLIIEPENQTARHYLREMGEVKLEEREESSSAESEKQTKEIESLQKNLDSRSNELAKLTGELKLQKEKLNQLFGQKDKAIEEKMVTILNLEMQLELTKAQLEQFQNESSSKDNQLKELQAKLKELESSSIKQVQEQQGKVQSISSQLEQASKDLQNKLLSSESQLSQAKTETQSKDNQIKELQTKVEELESTLGKQALDQQDKLSPLEVKLKSSQTDLQQAQKESQSKEMQVKQLEVKIKELESTSVKQDLERALQTAKLRDTMDKLQRSLQSLPDGYKAKIELAQKGLVITFLADILFNSGSAEIIPEGKRVLDNISGVLRNVTSDNQVIIEGYTDNVSIKYSRWKSNWELSNARALSVLHYLIYECGLGSQNLSTKGYGEFRPIGDNGTAEGRKQNRRVEIVIQPIL